MLYWLTFVALEANLARKIYGQHLVSNITIKYMNTNVKRKPSKALTFSFHGGSGTGKTYVSSIIAESIYKKGMRSKYVHFISGTEFLHNQYVPVYKVYFSYRQAVKVIIKCKLITYFLYQAGASMRIYQNHLT